MSSVLIFGASYGSVLATRLAMGGHQACLVCTPSTAQLINREGTHVRFPVKGRDQLVDVDSRKLAGSIRASAPAGVEPEDFDLVILAMQEPQYRQPEVHQLLERTASARVPCLAVMNMPPLAYLRRIDGLDAKGLEGAYAAPRAWDVLDPALVTLASPDPQAFRPAGEPKNVLQVGLPTNFKCAPFEDEQHTALLRQLELDIEASRYEDGKETIELPVKLKVHDSLFVPLAKWPMLLSGNYRCVADNGIIPIAEAVHGDVGLSREIYDWVSQLCVSLGAREDDLVPFDKYAAAASSLKKPSSVARALDAGGTYVERVDRLVQDIAAAKGLAHPMIDDIVARVDAAVLRNGLANERLAA